MFEKITIKSNNKTTLSGYADTEKISVAQISGLSNSWKHDQEKLLKNGSSTVAFLDGKLFIKCNPARSLFDSLRKNFCLSRAENSRIMAEKLNSIGVKTPEVLCAVRERRGIFVICDYLVTTALPEENTVFLQRINLLPQDLRTTALNGIIKLLAKLHANNIMHGDASLRNFYLDKTDNSIGTIDLDGCKRIFPLLKKRTVIREAARVASSWMICSYNDEEYDLVSRTLFDICGTGILKPEKLKKITAVYLKKTRRKNSQRGK